MSGVVRLDRLIGRNVLTANNRPLGRLQECRAELRGTRWVVTGWIVGPAGLFERLGVGTRMILGRMRPSGYIVRWDQLDLTTPDRPRLTCSVDDLARL